MNLPWQYIYQKIKTRFYRGLILIITDVGTECYRNGWHLPKWPAFTEMAAVYLCLSFLQADL